MIMRKIVVSLALAAFTLTSFAAAKINLSKADHEIAALAKAKSPNKISKGDYYPAEGFDENGYCFQIIDTEKKTAGVARYDAYNTAKTTTIPSSVTINGVDYSIIQIGGYAFQSATALQEIIIPDCIDIIEDWAFSYCSNLLEIVLPEKCRYVGAYTFYFDTSLSSVTLPTAIDCIWECCFANCYSLDNVVLPETVVMIQENAFYNCYSMTKFEVGKNVTEIVNNPWGDCSSLKGISVNENNEKFCSIDGVLFNKAKDTRLAYPDGHGNSYTVPEGTTKIGDYAFYYAEHLESVTLPETVKTIGTAGFFYCDEMASFNLPAGVEEIGVGAFYKTIALKNFTVDSKNEYYKAFGGVIYNKAGTVLVNFPCGRTGEYTPLSSTYAVADYAFGGAYVEKVNLPEGCELIGGGAFASSKVYAVEMPGVKEIYDLAFYYCLGLKHVIIYPKVEQFHDDVYKWGNFTQITSYAEKAPKCGNQVFEDLMVGMPLSVIVGCKSEYAKHSTFKMFNIEEGIYKVTAAYDEELGSVTVNGKNLPAYVSQYDDTYVTIKPNEGNSVKSVKVNGKDCTSELVEGELYLAAKQVNYNVVVEFVDATGVDTIEASEATETEYYNLHGVRVAEPENGMYIKIEKSSKGTNATKVVK